MSECKSCGRDDGHHIGCAEALVAFASGGSADVIVDPSDFCAFGDCDKPRRPKGKGRAPIYCEEHSDPKNRK